MSHVRPALLLLLLLVGGCGGSSGPWSVSPRAVVSPAGQDSSLPRLSVSADGPVLSWVERTGTRATLKYASWRDGEWSSARVAASGDDWFLSYADPPQVIRLANGTLVAQWEVQPDPRIEAMDIRLAHSVDGGRTWSTPITPHHDGTQTQHAFVSIFEREGGVGMVWLDGRESLLETDDPAGGAMTMQYAAFDGNWRQVAEAAVDHRVCECCSTAVAVTGRGPLVAFRDRDAREVRDIAVARFEGGAWSEPAIVHQDGYRTFACPVNGPALSVSGDRAAVAWFTVTGEQGHAFTAFSDDGGRSWGGAIRLDDSASLGRVDVTLLEDGGALASWVEFSGGASDIRVRRVDPGGERSAAVPVAAHGGGTTGGFPRLVRYDNQIVFAWTESSVEPGGSEGRQVVKTAVATIPDR